MSDEKATVIERPAASLKGLYWLLSLILLALIGVMVVQAIMLAMFISTAKDIFNEDNNGNFWLRIRLDSNSLGGTNYPLQVQTQVQSTSPGSSYYYPMYMKAVV
ncbi:hypothetical protein Unana1_03137 [Umbelopsis nana]